MKSKLGGCARARLPKLRGVGPADRVISLIGLPKSGVRGAVGRRPSALPFIVAFSCLVFGAVAHSQDIVITRSEKGAEVPRKGLIVRWQGDRLKLDVNGRERTIKNENIIRIETDWSEEYSQAEQAFQSHDFQNAVKLYAEALSSESRPWAQNIIRARLVQCHSLFENHSVAGQLFTQIIQSDPKSRFIEVIPLPWLQSLADTTLTENAKAWYQSNDPSIQLLGASWLLGSNLRSEATQTLETLAQSSDENVAALAKSQVWRGLTVTATERDAKRLMKQIDSMPNSIRAGAIFQLATIQSRLGQKDEAAINFMKLPILHAEHLRLSAAGLQKSANLLHNAGQTDEGIRLLREVVRDFSGTRFAAEAESILQSWTANN